MIFDNNKLNLELRIFGKSVHKYQRSIGPH